MSTEPEYLGIVTPWDEWALEHTGLTARQMIRKYPTLFPEEFKQLNEAAERGAGEEVGNG